VHSGISKTGNSIRNLKALLKGKGIKGQDKDLTVPSFPKNLVNNMRGATWGLPGNF
jgi:hypothetical protein